MTWGIYENMQRKFFVAAPAVTATTVDGALLEIRTARKRHRCERCHVMIEPGERYEDWRVPPWRGGNESPFWRRGKRHWDGDYPYGWACTEGAAYRERAAREAIVR